MVAVEADCGSFALFEQPAKVDATRIAMNDAMTIDGRCM
jgi:hypothetical protein